MAGTSLRAIVGECTGPVKCANRPETKNSSRFISEIAAASSLTVFQLFPVVGLSVRNRSGHRTEFAPGFPLFGIELFLLLLALFADRHKLVHRLLLFEYQVFLQQTGYQVSPRFSRWLFCIIPVARSFDLDHQIVILLGFII